MKNKIHKEKKAFDEFLTEKYHFVFFTCFSYR